ncbi:MAG: hypothetical protein KatS3mg056_2488 [Chloroflexus sp.]|nr:MAG: hypothetical protein KatS3mg056_2488 [Chloroflexus sp.]
MEYNPPNTRERIVARRQRYAAKQHRAGRARLALAIA